jgi:hypothetical protein
MPYEDDADMRVNCGRGRTRGHFKVDDFVEEPVAEPGDAFAEVAAGFVFRVDFYFYGDFGECDCDAAAEIFRERIVVAEGGFTPLVLSVSQTVGWKGGCLP